MAHEVSEQQENLEPEPEPQPLEDPLTWRAEDPPEASDLWRQAVEAAR